MRGEAEAGVRVEEAREGRDTGNCLPYNSFPIQLDVSSVIRCSVNSFFKGRCGVA